MRQLSKILLIITVFGAVFLFVRFTYADTTVGGSYSSDQHWTIANSPYIIEEDAAAYGVGILAGATLTIDPGVVIKFKPRTQLLINGTVIARGTVNDPITFTSFFDDSVGGDTDGLGPTIGSSGDWWRITGNNPHLEFDHTQIRYAGAGFELGLTNSPITVTNSILENNGYGFRLASNIGNLTIQNNIITNSTYGFLFSDLADPSNFIRNNIISNSLFRGAYNLTPAFPADMRNNSWGDPSGPFHPGLNPSGLGNEVTDGIIFDPWTEKTPPPPTKNPVIIIPGIYGTELWNQNELIWADLGRMFSDVNDQFLTDNLGLDGKGNSVNAIEIRKIIEKMAKEPFAINIFGNLIKEMLLDGYEADITLFTLPHDWRLDLKTSTILLNQKIQEIKNSTGANQVDLIAHSMGGLLAKDYLDQYGQDSIDKLIFVGTPHLGTPKATKVILFGDNINIPWLEADRIRELAHNSISAHELLPISKYFDQFTGYIKKYGSQNPLDYGQTKDFLLNEQGLNSTVFTEAENFLGQNLENSDLSGINAFNIAGCKTATQAGYQLNKNGSSVSKIKYTSGDGTVPMPSAGYVGLPAQNKFYVKNAKHAELPSTTGVRELVLGILNGQITLADNISRSQDFCNFKGKELLWRSPVAVHIYNSTGNHTGPIENNAIEYGIPGVDYDIIDGEKFIFLPTDEGQTYQIIAQGEANATFDLLISENVDGDITQTNVFNDVVITPQTIVDFDITETAAPNTIQVDLLGNGEIETVPLSAELLSGQGEDVVSPKTETIVSGTNGLDGWFTSPVLITLDATDDSSGILETRYSLDSGISFTSYTEPIKISNEGVTVLQFYSIDKAGNNEEAQTMEIKIDSTPPEITAQFNIDSRDFAFSVQDNLDLSPTLSCTETICQATDWSGHKTILEFKKRGLPRKGKGLFLKKLNYDSKEVILPNNLLAAYLTLHKNVIKSFRQNFSLQQKDIMSITYHTKKDQSAITDWTDNYAKTHIEAGIKILQVLTDGGILKINIK